MLLNLDSIKQAEDVHTEIVSMPEWGGDVKVKGMSFQQQLDFENHVKDLKNQQDSIFIMLQYCIVDEDNKPLFDNNTIQILKDKSANSLLKLFNVCLKLNNMNKDSIDNLSKN